MVGPDHEADLCPFKNFNGRGVILGGYDDKRASPGPLMRKFEYFIGLAVLAVDQNGISTCPVVGLRPFQRLGQTPAGNKSFDSGNDTKVIVRL